MKRCFAIGLALSMLCNIALAEQPTTTQRTFKTWKVEGSVKTNAQQDSSPSQWRKNLAAKAAEKQNAARRAQLAKENVQPAVVNKPAVAKTNPAPSNVKNNRTKVTSNAKVTTSKNNLKSKAKAKREQVAEKLKTATSNKQHIRWESYAKVGIKGVTGDAIVREAAKYKGIKYVFGGTTPKGFDCSGFVQYVFKKHNANLTRTADTQAKEGVFVTQRQLRPGDLVFFSTYEPGASHVGIYAGNGNFWSATSSRGIWLCGLHEDYWRTRYYGARRVLVTNGEPK